MPSDRNGVPFPPVRRLGPDDLRHCVRLSVDRGWLPETAKWSLLLEVSEVFGVDAPDGGDARLDLDPDRPGLPAWAVRHGLRPAGLNAVMAYGDRPPPGDPARLFTPTSIALA